MRISLIAITLLILFGCDLERPKVEFGLEESKKKVNIILMIADGMGYNHIQATNVYQTGEFQAQSYEKFPVSLFVSTYPAKSGKYNSESEENGLSWFNGYNSALTWSDSLWRKRGVTGSGASASAMATGRKTYNSSIGMDYNYKPLKTIAEKAKELGLSAGIVSSVQFTHATPASFAAHNVDRNNYEEIAREMIESDIDIIMGAGHPDFDDSGKPRNDKEYKYVGGKEYWEEVKKGNKNRKLITSKDEFKNLVDNPAEEKIIGIAEVANTLQEARAGDIEADPNSVQFIKTVPELKTMALGALNSLNQNKDGFFLMIEGGAVDWAGHSNLTGRMIEEQTAFNRTVDEVINWVNNNSNWNETLLIVTSDHETGYLTGVNGFNSIITSNGKGKVPNMKWNSKAHTNVLVPLYAKGNRSDLFDDYADELDSLRGYYLQNSEIGQVLFRVLLQ